MLIYKYTNMLLYNNISPSKIFYKDLSYKLVGILFDVHNSLGRYRNEQQYSDSIESFLKKSNLFFIREYIAPPAFKGEAPGRNKVDFLIEDKIILEIKAKRTLVREDYFKVRRFVS